jgi:phosphoglycerate kinase
MKTLKDFDLKNKKVLVRADFNVPLDEQNNILDDFRIRKNIPTIEYLINNQARIILISHLGRPDGKIVEKLRLTPIAERLSQLLNKTVVKTDDCFGQKTKETINQIKPGEIVLLENIQFNPGEKEKDLNFAQKLADYADFFVMEAFGQAHRDYASITGINQFIPSMAGFLLEKEINVLSGFLKNPVKPVVSIIGGTKAETKIKLIDVISEISDWVLVSSLMTKQIKEKKIVFKNPEKIVFSVQEDNQTDFDIGLKTIKVFKEKIIQAKTVFWNGPLGKTEEKEYQKGSKEIAQAIIESKAFSVIGGGETVEFMNRINFIDKFNHVSTGGGAMLDFIADGSLVGLEALK